MSSRSLSFLVPICGGLLVGATAIRLVQPTSPRALPPTAQTPLAPTMPRATLPAPTLVLPPKLAPAEAEAALDAWLALGAPADGSVPASLATQERALRALLTVLSDAQFPRLLETLHRRSGEAAVSLRQTVIGIWLHRHPPAAAFWVLTADLPAEGDTRYHLARQIGMFWAGQDALAAVAWAESIPDPALSTGVLEMILPNLAPPRSRARPRPRPDARAGIFRESARLDFQQMGRARARRRISHSGRRDPPRRPAVLASARSPGPLG